MKLKITEQRIVTGDKLEITFQDEMVQIEKLPRRVFGQRDQIVLSLSELETIFTIVRSHAVVKEFSKIKREG